jgi:translation initiation factor 5B
MTQRDDLIILTLGIRSLREGDVIVLNTFEGPIATTIQTLLTHLPSRELRSLNHASKSAQAHLQAAASAVGGSMRINIIAPDISRAIPGTTVLVQRLGSNSDSGDEDLDDLKSEVQSQLLQTLSLSLQTESSGGVTLHTSSFADLVALLTFLRDDCKPPVPVCHLSLCSVQKRDILRVSLMTENGQFPEYAIILAVNVMVDSDAQHLAEELHVRIFTADHLSHLLPRFALYLKSLREPTRRRDGQLVAVFPCIAQILVCQLYPCTRTRGGDTERTGDDEDNSLFLFSVEILEGQLRVGTPLCIPLDDFIEIGRVIGIEQNRIPIAVATRGSIVSVRVLSETNDRREFNGQHLLCSKLSRESIDALKESFRE